MLHSHRFWSIASLLAIFSLCQLLHAQGLGALRGHVKDPSGALISGANLTLKADNSDRKLQATTDQSGSFLIHGVPFGQYTLGVSKPGFASQSLQVQMLIGAAPTIDVVLRIQTSSSTVEVHDTTEKEMVAAEDSSAPVTVSESEIVEQLPGASRMSSLAFVTETTPGAFVLHDHLHVRGGHQTLACTRGPSDQLADQRRAGAQYQHVIECRPRHVPRGHLRCAD